MITSFLILIESITGLLLNERWLIGIDGEEGRGIPQMVNEARINPSDHNVSTLQQSQKRDEGGSSLMGIIRGLHEGHIGNVNMKWVMDLTAIGMIILMFLCFN